jgi:putative flippase GtrA
MTTAFADSASPESSSPALTRKAGAFWEACKYTVSSAIALAVDFGLMVLLVEVFSWAYAAAATASFLIGNFVNYGISATWAFQERKFKRRSVELLYFTGIGVAGAALNTGLIFLFTEDIGTNYMVSKCLATGITFTFNFVLRRFIIFRAPARGTALS